MLVEPHIDTIELDDDTDTEEPGDHPKEDEEATDKYEECTAAVAAITEALQQVQDQDGLSNVQIVEATHITSDNIVTDQNPEVICDESASPPTDEELLQDSQLDNDGEMLTSAVGVIAVPNEGSDAEAMAVEETDLSETVSDLGRLESNKTQFFAAAEANILPETIVVKREEDGDEIETSELKELECNEQLVVEQLLKEQLDCIKVDSQAELHESNRIPVKCEEEHLIETIDKPKELESNTWEPDDLKSISSPTQPRVVEQVLKEKQDSIRVERQAELHDIDSDENDTLFTYEPTNEVHLQDLVIKIKEELTEDSKEAGSSMVIGELPNNLEFIDDGIDFIEESDDDGK